MSLEVTALAPPPPLACIGTKKLGKRYAPKPPPSKGHLRHV